MPSTSMSPTTLPPSRSPILGSWLPVTQIHSRSSCMICRISSSSRPMRWQASSSCRLSPSAMTVRGLVAVDDLGEALQRLARVVGRQELAAARRRPSPSRGAGRRRSARPRSASRARPTCRPGTPSRRSRWSGPGNRRRRDAPASARAYGFLLLRLFDELGRRLAQQVLARAARYGLRADLEQDRY